MSRSADGRSRWRRAGRLAAAAATLALVAVSSCAMLRPTHDGPVTGHFDGARFYDDPPVRKGLLDVLRWRLESEPGGPWTRDLAPVTGGKVADRVDPGELAVTFVNHATVLIQIDGLNVVTDPIWARRASPFDWAGPERYRAPGLRFRDLPPVDLVLVSHNHFDHMDLFSLGLLAESHDPLFVVPLGNCFYLQRVEGRRCVELDWWESRDLGGARRVHAVPARHWSRRGALDTNRSLWAGYVLEAPGHRVYFAGDTGMGEHFVEIRERIGPPDLALLPIGAYLPRWFMAPQHINPEEAVLAHRLLGAAQSMAIHFGTFRLADDGQDQPVEALRAALAAAAEPPDGFWIPAHGETRRWHAHTRTAKRD